MEYAIVYYVTATVTPTERIRQMEQNIFVDPDTMAELAAEEARVRQQCIEEIGRACVKAANILTVAMVRNERHGSARLVELYQDADNALTALGAFAYSIGKEN